MTESQVRALDNAIQSLDRQISASTHPKIDEKFKESWRAFTSRWQIQRDSWLQAGSVTRKFGFSEAVFDQFRVSYAKWLNDFQSRFAGTAKAPPPAPKPAPVRPLFGNFFAGSGTAIVIAGLIVGGYLYLIKKGK